MPINPFVVPDAAEEANLQNLLNKVAPSNFVLKLFSNNHTPVSSDTAANYTEATFPGYAAITLAGAGWTTVQGSPTTATHSQQTFTCSANFAGQTIYGYFLVDGSNIIRGAQLFDAVETIKSNTETIKVTPVYTGQSAA